MLVTNVDLQVHDHVAHLKVQIKASQSIYLYTNADHKLWSMTPIMIWGIQNHHRQRARCSSVRHCNGNGETHPLQPASQPGDHIHGLHALSYFWLP